ncbi:unnamed protein product [Chilo suppressalis]|uniref:Gonadal protein gdl n=1 Tax=Chilo suppressalis TaxID=168631 RepID=A0ABN8BGZ6_CHISP|nr:unnamed protein product [Chilo suppressalis]
MEPTPEALQRKLYFLLEQLQEMARELPPKYQMRVPIELLSGLANCLLNDTVFEIVKGLMEIQHVTEKHLFQQRLQVINKHTLEIQNMVNNTPNLEQQEIQKAILWTKHKEELKQTDMKLVMQLDQKVSDQQVTLEKAEVPGFYVTNKPIEVKVQMYLLDFILRLSQMEIPHR